MAKIVVIGAGHVGSHVALECARQALAEEIVLLDIDAEKAWAHAEDIADAGVRPRVCAGGYDAVRDADIAVMAACNNGYESADRLLELPYAAEVAREVADGLSRCGFSGTVVSITNPCDVIAHFLAAQTGLRVVGTGTGFDSVRFRLRIARALGVDAARVAGYCLGEHGDSQVPALSTVRVDGKPLDTARREALQSVSRETVAAGWEIATRKGCTEFGIGASAARLIRALLRNEGAEMACSVRLNGAYGGRDVYAGIPCVVGKAGATPLPEYALEEGERAALQRSFAIIERHIKTIL